MEIKVDFSELWGHVRRLSESPVEFDWTAAPLDPIDIDLLKGRQVRLEDLDIINGLLSVDGRQVLLYIPDQSKPVDVVQSYPKEGRRFHVADCKTLTDMRAKGRFERYLVTNNLTGIFPISGKNSRGYLEELDSSLLVCMNCLEKLNYENYCHGSRHHVWQSFNIARFFETYSTSFAHLPRSIGPRVSGNDYTADWAEVSAYVRRRSDFKCDDCGLVLADHRHLLHVHHVNGVKQDNTAINLRPLCADCHRKQPLHEHMFISAADMRLLTRLRREQGIVAGDWAQVINLADLSVRGALMHARQKGFAVPELGAQLVRVHSLLGVEVEVAWPAKQLAISISYAPEVEGWTILTPTDFIESH